LLHNVLLDSGHGLAAGDRSLEAQLV